MALISEQHKKHVRQELASLQNPVRILVFTQEMECQFCREARSLAEEIAELSDKISVEVYDFMKDARKAEEHRIDKVPALALIGKRDYGIRYYGIPAGYEFGTFLKDLRIVSKGATDISEKSRTKLASVSSPVHIQVFVTPTCPYCPMAVSLAHQFAVESPQVRADMIDVTEFPYLGQKYAVTGVPKVVINERVEFTGLLPEDQFLQHIIVASRPVGAVYA
jgi:glutaredoxin-like protein